jgi:hypothetical protein
MVAASAIVSRRVPAVGHPSGFPNPPRGEPRSLDVRRRGPSGPAGLETHLIPLPPRRIPSGTGLPVPSGTTRPLRVCAFKGNRPNCERTIPRGDLAPACRTAFTRRVRGSSAGVGRFSSSS